MQTIEVSAILPVYNDRKALEIAIPASLERLDMIAPGRFEVIVAEDGAAGVEAGTDQCLGGGIRQSSGP